MRGRLIARRGIIVAGILALLLQGLATTSLALTFGEIMLCVITAGQPELCAGKLIPKDSPSLPSLTCSKPELAGPPQFLSMPKGSAKYRFSGGCNRTDLTGIQLKYRWEGSWTPSETDRQKPNTSESIEITGYELYLPDRAPGGKIYMYWTARCNYDPWLRPETSGGCRRFGEVIPPDLRDMVPDLTGQGFPQTLHAIAPADRQRFAAEYLKANPPVAGPVPGGIGPMTAFQEIPKITVPHPNSTVVLGQLLVKAMRPRIGGSPVTELEFKWLDAPPNQPHVNTFVVDTAKLEQGYAVDPKVTRIQYGRWEVRARVSGRPVPGPWSPSVPFQLVTTQPTQSQHIQPPNPAIPPPSNIPFTVEGQKRQSTSGTRIFRPQMTPQEGMGSGPALIRPRGVDEHDKGAASPDSEK